MEGKYSIELFRDGGEGAGIEKILVRHDSLTAARVLYKAVVLNYEHNAELRPVHQFCQLSAFRSLLRRSPP